MMSSVDGRDPRMSAPSTDGPRREGEAGLPSEGGLAPHCGAVGLQEEEAGPHGEGKHMCVLEC